jgi:hypothetical protein
VWKVERPRSGHKDMAVLSMPNVISFRAQITMVVLLSAITFAYGFISAFQAGQKEASCERSYMSPAEKLENSEVGSQVTSEDVTSSDSDLEITETRSAVFSTTLPFPFESVLQAWEGGPPDPNFIKEEVHVEMHGLEERRSKTIYTKNPLPYVIRKTVRALWADSVLYELLTYCFEPPFCTQICQ